jgi:magnesium chelatase family protein
MVSCCQKRISGPLLDRIDTLRDMEVPRGEYEKLSDDRLREPVQERQRQRFAGTHLLSKADMGQGDVWARTYHRILKLVRNIAELARSDKIETVHLAEAIRYRPRRQRQGCPFEE